MTPKRNDNNKNRRRWTSPTTILTIVVVAAGLILQYGILGSTVDANTGSISDVKVEATVVKETVYALREKQSVHEASIGHTETIKKLDALEDSFDGIRLNQATLQNDVGHINKSMDEQKGMLQEILNRLP